MRAVATRILNSRQRFILDFRRVNAKRVNLLSSIEPPKRIELLAGRVRRPVCDFQMSGTAEFVAHSTGLLLFFAPGVSGAHAVNAKQIAN
jgi:hypothetical protein